MMFHIMLYIISALLVANKRCQRPWRFQCEDIIEYYLHSVFAGFNDNLDSIDAGAANFKEVVGSSHLLNL